MAKPKQGDDTVEPSETTGSTPGRITVRTPYGYAFQSNEGDRIMVTHEGTKVTRAEADALIAEADTINPGLVTEVKNED